MVQSETDTEELCDSREDSKRVLKSDAEFNQLQELRVVWMFTTVKL